VSAFLYTHILVCQTNAALSWLRSSAKPRLSQLERLHMVAVFLQSSANFLLDIIQRTAESESKRSLTEITPISGTVRNVHRNMGSKTICRIFYLWVLHPVAHLSDWFFMTPSIATKFQYVNPPSFSFLLTTCFGPYGPSSGEIYN
jgi:hypothetical protein